tara:strand:- start:310 stop:618 length:309 start_codon:yes stop_codon:yes gene_type:complete
MLNKIKKNIFILSMSFLFIYFLFNLFDGNRGLISYFEKKDILNNLIYKERVLSNKIKDLELKNSLISNNLDLDFIETLIRDKFIYGKTKDNIYIIRDETFKN